MNKLIDFNDIQDALCKDDDLSFFRALALAVNANDGQRVIELLRSKDEVVLNEAQIKLCLEQEIECSRMAALYEFADEDQPEDEFQDRPFAVRNHVAVTLFNGYR